MYVKEPVCIITELGELQPPLRPSPGEHYTEGGHLDLQSKRSGELGSIVQFMLAAALYCSKGCALKTYPTGSYLWMSFAALQRDSTQSYYYIPNSSSLREGWLPYHAGNHCGIGQIGL